jgi:hypothetical protein
MYVILLAVMIAGQTPTATVTLDGDFKSYFECLYWAGDYANFVNQQNAGYRVISYQCREATQ